MWSVEEGGGGGEGDLVVCGFMRKSCMAAAESALMLDI